MFMFAQDATAVQVSESSWREALLNLTSTGSLTMILIFGIPIVGIVMGSLVTIMRIRAKERTRQEVAAYVAEGSMSAEEGERSRTCLVYPEGGGPYIERVVLEKRTRTGPAFEDLQSAVVLQFDRRK